ncbi:MAG TPA: cytochrome c [Candidatus Limnocylindria bacterium]|nr:cytochrome c [Candidatus Limnocylindria bacterium]
MRKGALAVILAVAAVAMSCAAEPRATDPVARGRQVYRETGCASCHEPQLVNLFRPAGPPLDRIGTVAATRRPGLSDVEYLRQSIVDPGAYVVPGYPDSMPRGLGDRLSSEDLADLVQYLSTLR